jgi:hypothetical protein
MFLHVIQKIKKSKPARLRRDFKLIKGEKIGREISS